MLILQCHREEKTDVPVPEKSAHERVMEITVENPVKDAQIEYTETGHMFHFNLQNTIYTMTMDGRITRHDSGGAKSSYSLNIQNGDYIEYLKYLFFRDDLILIYETASEESDGGQILRLTGRDLRLQWHQYLPGFNLDAGPVEDHFLYVSAIGMVGKLNLMTGDWVWQHNQLFENNGSFSAFQKPILQGDSIIFREEDIMKKNIKRFVLNKETGEPFR